MCALGDFFRTVTGRKAKELLVWIEHEHHRRGEIIKQEIRATETAYIEGEGNDRR